MAAPGSDGEGIQTALADAAQRKQICILCEKKFLTEIPPFLTQYDAYLKSAGSDRKKVADTLIASFLTATGYACLPDYKSAGRSVTRRLKKCGDEYPDDLFQDAMDSVIFTIRQEVWDEFQGS